MTTKTTEEFYVIAIIVYDKFGEYSFDYMEQKDGTWVQTMDIRFAKKYYFYNKAKEALEDILNSTIVPTDGKDYYIAHVREERTSKIVSYSR